MQQFTGQGNQISILTMKNLKLTAFAFKNINHCSKAYDIKCISNTSVLQYQHQWELEQKKTENTKVSTVDKDDQAKTMENTILHFNLIRGVRGVWLAYVV